jgi:hypothetical protein
VIKKAAVVATKQSYNKKRETFVVSFVFQAFSVQRKTINKYLRAVLKTRTQQHKQISNLPIFLINFKFAISQQHAIFTRSLACENFNHIHV